MKVIKLIIIFLIFIGIAWFGGNFGPSSQSDLAEAKVFERLFHVVQDMPEYLYAGRSTDKPQKVMINGITTYLDVEKTTDDIKSVFDFYEKMIPPQPMERPDIDLADADDQKLKNSLKVANQWIDMFESVQHIRIERDDYGLWGAFELHDSNLKIGSKAFFPKLEAAVTTGQIGDLGTGRAVIALKNGKQGEMTLIKIWTDRDFNLNNFAPGPDGDFPGFDIDDVPRYPGDKRMMSVEQKNRSTIDRVAAYSGKGSIAGHILFFHSRMKGAGWQRNIEVEKVVRENANDSQLYYAKNGRDVTVHIRPDETRQKILTTIIERKNKAI
ncbi:MAG: hypothetical protein PF482_02690 [Desulfobacteraceae bacterium]|jgi:hypothetical protein|nr:hypothetical protein [Desulfobacteraceae bacterium]